MIKRDITYKDLDGNVVSDTFYFNISMSEVLAKAADTSYVAKLTLITKGADKLTIIKTFTDLLGEAVGKRSEDGKYLRKDIDITESFMQSDAFEVLLWQMINDQQFAAEMVEGIFPAELLSKAQELARNSGVPESELRPEPPKRAEDYTHDELVTMSTEDFHRLVGRDPKAWSSAVKVVAMDRRIAGKE